MNQPRTGYTNHGTQTTPEPLPPPDTRSWDQRVHEQNLTTIANEAKPLSAMLAFSRQNVVLGIELDLLSVRVKDAEAANTVLSARIEDLQSDNQFLDREKSVQATTIRRQADDIQKIEETRNKTKIDLIMKTEQLRNHQRIIDSQSKKITALKERSDKIQSVYIDEILEFAKANASSMTQLKELKKAHSLLLQQIAAQPQVGLAHPDSSQKDEILTNKAVQRAASANDLIKSQNKVEEQRDKVVKLTSENATLKKQLKDESTLVAIYKFGDTHKGKDLQRTIADLEKIKTQSQQLKDQMETLRQEHTEATEKLNLKIREDKETMGKMAASIKEDKTVIEKLQMKTPKHVPAANQSPDEDSEPIIITAIDICFVCVLFVGIVAFWFLVVL